MSVIFITPLETRSFTACLSELLSRHSMRAISQRETIRYSLKKLDLQSFEGCIRTNIKAVGL